MKLTVKTLKGELIELEVEPNNTVPFSLNVDHGPEDKNQGAKGIRSRFPENSFQGQGHYQH